MGSCGVCTFYICSLYDIIEYRVSIMGLCNCKCVLFTYNTDMMVIFHMLQLLDSLTILCVMVLSFIFLRIRYKIINLMGVTLSLIGILSLVLATVMGSRSNNG